MKTRGADHPLASAGDDRGGRGRARRRARECGWRMVATAGERAKHGDAAAGIEEAPPGPERRRPLPGAGRRRLDPARAAPLRPHRRPGLRRQLRHRRLPRRGRARRGRGGDPPRLRRRDRDDRPARPRGRDRRRDAGRPQRRQLHPPPAGPRRRAQLQDRRRGGRARPLRRARRRDAGRIHRLQPRQPGPDPRLGREGLRGQLHRAALAHGAGAGRRPRRRPPCRQRRRPRAGRRRDRRRAAATLEPGAELEVGFAEEVGRLAQLPGTSFYQRIREKFGHLAV